MKTLLDKQPYSDSAQITAVYAADKEPPPNQYSLFTNDDGLVGNHKTNNVRYATDRWAGYRYQPQKAVFYYGMSYFIPYQEQNSNLLRDSNANIRHTSTFDSSIVNRVANILSIDYTSLQSNSVANDSREEHVISALKSTISYSENHMGCGEGRLLKLVDALENAPDQSLFVIEEPETALHQLAQHKLAEYLIDVCLRKHHQIIFTTHSPYIQKALPQEARKFIKRDDNGETKVISSPSIAQIENYLTGGFVKGMIIVTEDDVGAIYIKEILREYAPSIQTNCAIFPMKLGLDEIKKYVQQSQNCGICIYGIIDEHRHLDINKHLLAFPDDTPPEVSIVIDQKTAEDICKEFRFDCTQLSGDHHEYFNIIAKQTDEEEDYVRKWCIKQYVRNKGQDYFREIIEQMSHWLGECN